MKSTLWMVVGFCAAVAGFLTFGCPRIPSVQLLDQPSDNFWDDHPAVVETT
jgi:predicted DNA-binding transcriptional regulator YafY